MPNNANCLNNAVNRSPNLKVQLVTDWWARYKKWKPTSCTAANWQALAQAIYDCCVTAGIVKIKKDVKKKEDVKITEETTSPAVRRGWAEEIMAYLTGRDNISYTHREGSAAIPGTANIIVLGCYTKGLTGNHYIRKDEANNWVGQPSKLDRNIRAVTVTGSTKFTQTLQTGSAEGTIRGWFTW